MNLYSATGRLGKDCRLGNAGGTAVCNFPLAVDSGFGEKKRTLWFDCALWGKKAESRLPEYLTKGAQVAVSGELGTREHEGKTYLTLRVGKLDLIGGKSDTQNEYPNGAHKSGTAGIPGEDLADDLIPFNSEAA